VTDEKNLLQALASSPGRASVTEHPFFGFINRTKLEKGAVSAFLGQYWYPLHFFPTFLSRLVANAPTTEVKAVVSRILWQELGQGEAARSHEALYIETMEAAGLDRRDFVDVPPLPSTRALVEGYARASQGYLPALGWLYGTEVNDLAIVVGLGRAVRQISTHKELPWVTVHAREEPSHVKDASQVAGQSFTQDEHAAIAAAAEESWRLWAAFFTELHQLIGRPGSRQELVA
jgi:pyrroloquinoline quinone (PQQ) biosynthesis protein C